MKALDILDLERLKSLWIAGESIPLSSPRTNHKSCFSTNNVTSETASTLLRILKNLLRKNASREYGFLEEKDSRIFL